ncbi:MAG: hypothetical protein AAB573_02055 [Patescibacteria group bacterium]
MDEKYSSSDLIPTTNKNRAWRQEPTSSEVETEAAANRRRIRALQQSDQLSDKNERARKLARAKPARLKLARSFYEY